VAERAAHGSWSVFYRQFHGADAGSVSAGQRGIGLGRDIDSGSVVYLLFADLYPVLPSF